MGCENPQGTGRHVPFEVLGRRGIPMILPHPPRLRNDDLQLQKYSNISIESGQQIFDRC